MERSWIVRLVDLKGFGGASRSEGVLRVEGSSLKGQILSPRLSESIVERVTSLRSSANRVVELDFDDAQAVGAGMACGGVAQVAVFDEREFPNEYFELERQRTPFVVVTSRHSSGRTQCYVIDSTSSRSKTDLPQEILDKVEEVNFSMRKGTTSIQLDETKYYVSLVAPTTHIVTLGGGDLAKTLKEMTALLGWDAEVVEKRVDGGHKAAIEPESLLLGPLDALVVLSHDHDFTTPFIASALKSRSGAYIGSLGSRHTQTERRMRLLEQGFVEQDLTGLYGPIGLDAAAQSVGETALVICAEIQVHKSKRPLRHLRDSLGPINA